MIYSWNGIQKEKKEKKVEYSASNIPGRSLLFLIQVNSTTNHQISQTKKQGIFTPELSDRSLVCLVLFHRSTLHVPAQVFVHFSSFSLFAAVPFESLGFQCPPSNLLVT
jgi:hypothetical protein